MKEREEQLLTESRSNLNVDILKAGHHGSSSSSPSLFFKSAKPEMAIICCGQVLHPQVGSDGCWYKESWQCPNGCKLEK